ncbi:DUF998 domain-containing protein [Desulfurococcus mucosus]|uniref:DUF998 domain-containing protein n=1 Tax=Desulfurococcus mucosus (strain ATCC 35584 / DSM 2162 / JCM 9187 / O7/1) TaxID=765177 RepID=E8R6Y1_DESM0|nr:DUF998 domain-containing protein [Desulfurococcus mucosus]ADV64414.1 protein of unknown function DUF998 [Desulfurococcus mucosus DSM 2162]
MNPRLLVLASVAVPLSSIAIAALLSNWFNPLENALSDLGHAARSSVAAVFNGGLVFGGLLTYTVAVTSRQTRRSYNMLLALTAVFLILIGVYDEIYGRLHFAVSVAFFTGTMIFMAWITVKETSKVIRAYSVSALLIELAAWIIYFMYRIPRGAAIPELISVASFTPLYIYIYSRGNQHA